MAAVANKRKANSTKPVCKYGAKCYRKNAQHLRNYSHPGRDEEDDESSQDGPPPKAQKTAAKNQKGTITNYFNKDEKKKREEHNVSDSDGDDDETSKNGKDVASSSTATTSSDASKDVSIADDQANTELKEDDTTMPESPEDVKESIKMKFLTEMPDDFYDFWEFCKASCPKCPQDALKSTFNLQLAGPFDILAGRHKGVVKNKTGKRPNFLLHHRFYYDPPEFQTVICLLDGKSQFHIGYYRDDPKEAPVFLASNSPGDPATKEKLYKCGDNLFAAVYIFASKEIKNLKGQSKAAAEKQIKSLEAEAKKHGYSLAANTDKMKARQKKVVCPTFHGAGIVVPVDDNEVGYRPVPETIADLKVIFKGIAEPKSEKDKEQHSDSLQELITLVQFANDECDYGEGLELGLDLFSFGSAVFHPHVENLLPLAYQLLNREEFSQIIEAHLKSRSTVVDQLS